MTRPVGIVLAGGASSRFGHDKITAEHEGRPLVQHALERVAQVVDDIVLVLAPDADVPPLPPDLADRITIARDPAAHGGPLAGLATGLDATADRVPAIALVVGADMPRLAPAVLQLLVAKLEDEPTTGAAILESDPPATLPMAIAADLARLAANALLAENRRSLHALLDTLHATTIPAATWRALTRTVTRSTTSTCQPTADFRLRKDARPWEGRRASRVMCAGSSGRSPVTRWMQPGGEEAAGRVVEEGAWSREAGSGACEGLRGASDRD